MAFALKRGEFFSHRKGGKPGLAFEKGGNRTRHLSPFKRGKSGLASEKGGIFAFASEKGETGPSL
jgi:hypothetical protein